MQVHDLAAQGIEPRDVIAYMSKPDIKQYTRPPRRLRHFRSSAGWGAVCTIALSTGVAAAPGQPGDSVLPVWKVERGVDPYTHADACLLTTQPLIMPDGYGTARVQLVLGPRALIVLTDSNIDPSYPRQGLTVDDKPVIEPDAPFPLQGQSVLFEHSVAEVIERFRRGRRAELQLGFWPSWPVTETKRLALSLRGFSKAHESLTACRDERDTATNQ
ncbi:hypothetical protein [Thiocapsa sp.]|uniref:hypothetical protein n=1 Tax=Thiocapsa sp. TaxID=2024551 RepID=UPI00359483DD